MNSILNFNIGVLGHIDSGKTSLAKALSTVAATASFDKNPQSQERGITIDLGFSSFSVDIPQHLKSINSQLETLQFTLVDCPGHASLIRTIIGGAQIIDLMMLVIDVTKGMQTQTAECLILGEITCDHMLIVLNKTDLLAPDKKEILIEKMKKKMLKTLEKTKFHDASVISVSAKPGSEDGAKPEDVDVLVKAMCEHAYIPKRSSQGQFLFAVDHCFAIKGQGTVMTGTVIQGQVSISHSVEIPIAKITRKVKSIQMFKKSIENAKQGDRIGICVTQFDPKLLERGAVCTPGYMDIADSVIVSVKKIPYFKGKCTTNSKFHISIMHDTIMAKCFFFGALASASKSENENEDEFDYNQEYIHLDEIFDPNETSSESKITPSAQFVLLHLEKPVILSKNSMLIGSKLDTDIHSNICRLAFYGKVLSFESKKQNSEMLSKLKVYKEKVKQGIVERMSNEYQVIVKDLFKKETNIQLFVNFKVKLSSGEDGIIEGSFGQSGKVNVRIPNGLAASTLPCLKVTKKGKGEQTEKVKSESITVTLLFKKYIYSSKKQIFQSK